MEETTQNLAKPMRSPCEVLANNTLSTPDPCAVTTLSAGFGVACSAGAGKVGHSQMEEAENMTQPFLSLTPWL
jgi:hypothetical protein